MAHKRTLSLFILFFILSIASLASCGEEGDQTDQAHAERSFSSIRPLPQRFTQRPQQPKEQQEQQATRTRRPTRWDEIPPETPSEPRRNTFIYQSAQPPSHDHSIESTLPSWSFEFELSGYSNMVLPRPHFPPAAGSNLPTLSTANALKRSPTNRQRMGKVVLKNQQPPFQPQRRQRPDDLRAMKDTTKFSANHHDAPFQCHYCSERFTTTDVRNHHHRDDHPNEEWVKRNMALERKQKDEPTLLTLEEIGEKWRKGKKNVKEWARDVNDKTPEEENARHSAINHRPWHCSDYGRLSEKKDTEREHSAEASTNDSVMNETPSTHTSMNPLGSLDDMPIGWLN